MSDTLLGNAPEQEEVDALAPLSSSLARNNARLAKVNEDISMAIADMLKKQKHYQERDAKIREEITKAMKDRVANGGEKKYEDENISVTYVAPHQRKKFDSAGLKKDHPDIYKQYEGFTEVAESVRMTAK